MQDPAETSTGAARTDLMRPTTRIPVRVEETVAVLSLAVLVGITFTNVVVRYLTDHSFAVTEEVSIFLMVLLTMAGAAAAAARDRHIRIEYFLESGGASRRRRLALFSALATAAFFLVLAWLLGRYSFDEYRYGEISMALGLPRWWYSIWLPLLALAIALRALGLAWRLKARP